MARFNAGRACGRFYLRDPARPARLTEGRSMAHLKWIIESFFEATEDVKFPDAMLKRLITVADTSEDIGLSRFYLQRWQQAACFHEAVEHLAQHVRSAILTPNGCCSGVLGIEKKTGRAVVFDAALKEWWPKIQCEIAKIGNPNFKRLRVLLTQENARAVQQFPRMKKSLEKNYQSLVRCLNGVESLVFRSTQKGEAASNESASVAVKAMRVQTKTAKVGSQTGGKCRPTYSPWIDAPQFIEVLKMNCIMPTKRTKKPGDSDRTISRKKKLWKAEPQQGTHNQKFRFDLSFLDANGVCYPTEWRDSPARDTSRQ